MGPGDKEYYFPNARPTLFLKPLTLSDLDNHYTDRYNDCMLDNREFLLRNACHLFATRGYDAVGVQEIVESSGVTKPTLYHYFGSKHGLLNAILENQLLPLSAQLADSCRYQQDLVYSLEQIVRFYFQFAQREPGFFRLWMTIRFAPPESIPYQAIAPYLNQQHQLISNLFQQAAEQHGNMRGRHNSYAVSLMGMIFSYAAMGIQGEHEINDQLVYTAVHQYMYGIFS
ncbi:MAG: TetR/AcrR family transcriptional regulator [Chloroflexi bacterium HGW-Chloroflexi-10]|nr:MAG: TetR/AcrR family transcriptional regulator [Chloroflexi bacterium HGW-Chloroflexi-10]